MLKCSKCGFESKDNAAFCLKCGNKLNKSLVINQVPCPICKTDNNANAAFCKKCGNKFEIKQQNQDIKICIKCKAANDISNGFCNTCGALFKVKKRNNKFLLIILLAIIFIIAAAVVSFMLFKDNLFDLFDNKTNQENQIFNTNESIIEANGQDSTDIDEQLDTWIWNNNYPQLSANDRKDAYVIYNEGYRDNRVEIAVFDIGTATADSINIIWDDSLQLNNQSMLNNREQYYLKDGKWIDFDSNNSKICDKATGVIASNLNIYDAKGTLVLTQNDFSENRASSVGTAIHRYSYVVSDSGWNKAHEEAKKAGGYLAHINTEEELKYISNEINKLGYDNIQFYLGGRRDLQDSKYYWVDGDNAFFGDCLNDKMGTWFWMKNEPSLKDVDINIEESYVSVLYYDNKWVGNDVTENIAKLYPQFSQKVGYIIEYET